MNGWRAKQLRRAAESMTVGQPKGERRACYQELKRILADQREKAGQDRRLLDIQRARR